MIDWYHEDDPLMILPGTAWFGVILRHWRLPRITTTQSLITVLSAVTAWT